MIYKHKDTKECWEILPDKLPKNYINVKLLHPGHTLTKVGRVCMVPNNYFEYTRKEWTRIDFKHYTEIIYEK